MKRFLIALIFIILGFAAGFVLGHFYWPSVVTTSTTQTSTTPQLSSDTATNTICKSDNLTLAFGDTDGGGAAGSTYLPITITNSGTSTCTMNGYPSVSLRGDGDQIVGQTAEQDTSKTAGLVTLAAGRSATATLRFVADNFDEGVCKTGATTLKVYAPGDTGFLTIPTNQDTWCPGFSTTVVSAN